MLIFDNKTNLSFINHRLQRKVKQGSLKRNCHHCRVLSETAPPPWFLMEPHKKVKISLISSEMSLVCVKISMKIWGFIDQNENIPESSIQVYPDISRLSVLQLQVRVQYNEGYLSRFHPPGTKNISLHRRG